MSLARIKANDKAKTFLYFAFGSNLLTERIHLNNPSAIKVSVGKLKNYKLSFGHNSDTWKGAVATIMEDDNSHVYGVLWQINIEDLKNLDKQESVHIGIYSPIEVTVECENEELVKARTYKLNDCHLNHKLMQPSYVYLNVILKGARDNGLPEAYIKQLEKIQHNGYKGDVGVKISATSNYEKKNI